MWMSSESSPSSPASGCSTEVSLKHSWPLASHHGRSFGARRTRRLRLSSAPAWRTAPWMLLRFGPMSAPLTDAGSVDGLMRSLEAFPARTSASPGIGQALAQALAQGFSSTCSGSHPIAERSSSFWRMSGGLFPLPPLFRRRKMIPPPLPIDSDEDSQTAAWRRESLPWSPEPWPMPGLTLRGCLYALPMLARPTGGSAGSASDGGWATPTEFGNHNRAGLTEKSGDGLATQVKGWPTPRTEDAECAGGHRGKDDTLYGAICRPKEHTGSARPTPMASDHRSGLEGPETLASNSRPLRSAVANPSLWPTPSVADGTGGHLTRGGDRSNELLLPGAAKAWPTPMAHDAGSGNPDRVGRFGTKHGGRNLADEALLAWPTPRASSESGGGAGLDGGAGSRAMMDKVLEPSERAAMGGGNGSGQLNPAWVELLMGWPLGWTSLEPCAGVFPGWPMGMGPDKHPYEPPRKVPTGTLKDRAARLKMLGNGVVPQQAALSFLTILGFVLKEVAS